MAAAGGGAEGLEVMRSTVGFERIEGTKGPFRPVEATGKLEFIAEISVTATRRRHPVTVEAARGRPAASIE
jgi:hypothetical protein